MPEIIVPTESDSAAVLVAALQSLLVADQDFEGSGTALPQSSVSCSCSISCSISC
jgi:hypothetical protein